jgi:hypothetical protein
MVDPKSAGHLRNGFAGCDPVDSLATLLRGQFFGSPEAQKRRSAEAQKRLSAPYRSGRSTNG